MTIPEHFIQLDKYVFVQGLDDFSSWWFLTRFQFCFSDKCTFLMLLWFFVLCQTINFIACTTSYKHTIRLAKLGTRCTCHPLVIHILPSSTKVYPFPTLVNISLCAYLYHTPCSTLVLSNFLFFFLDSLGSLTPDK
jgi:hypothetical protein